MANVTTDQWLGALLGGKPSAPARPTDEELLAGLAPVQSATPPQAVATPVLAPMLTAPASTSASVDQEDAPTPTAESSPSSRQSRVDALLSSLQAPTRGEHAMAAMFDSLFGGTRYQDDVRGRRNQFDQALIGAHAADASAAERATESERARAMQDRQFKLQERGQDLADARAKEDRLLRDLLSERAVGAANQRQTARDEAALERAKIVKAGGGGGGPAAPISPEEKAKEDAQLAAWLMQQTNVPREQAEAYVAGNIDGLPKAAQDKLWAAASQFAGLDKTEQKRVVKSRLSSEGNMPDATAATRERKQLDPKERLKLKDDITNVGRDVNEARLAWKAMSPTAQRVFASLAGEGGDLAQAVKSAVLSPEDQQYATKMQALANVLIKARSGSAVTGSEWNRVAQEIGWPTGDWSIFNSPSGVDAWLDKSKRAWVGRVKNVKSEYGDIFGGVDGGQ